MGSLGRALYSIGFWIRETGQAIDRLGCALQGSNAYKEQRKIPCLRPLVALFYRRNYKK